MALKPMTETGRGDSGVFWNYANSKTLQKKTHPGDAVDGNHCFFCGQNLDIFIGWLSRNLQDWHHQCLTDFCGQFEV